MKNLLSKLFGRRAVAPPPPPAAPDPRKAAAQLRQSLQDANSESELREGAARLGELLGRAGISPDSTDPHETWIAAVCAATDNSRAQLWVEKCSSEEDLEHIALTARLTDTRLTAARRITDIHRIERLAESIRNKDRGVFRHCQAVLKSNADQTKRAEQIQTAVIRLQALAEKCPMPKGHLHELRKLIGQLPSGDDLADCRALLERLCQREQAEEQALIDLERQLARAAKLRQALNGDPWPVFEHLDDWKSQAGELSFSLQAIPDWLSAHASVANLREAVVAIEASLGRLMDDQAKSEACERFLKELDASSLAPQAAETWDTLPKPQSEAAMAALQQQWQAIHARQEKPEPKAAPKAVRPSIDLTEIETCLSLLEKAVEAGETQQSFVLAKEFDQLTENARIPRPLLDRYHRLQSQISQWRDWARWSGGRARTDLIEAAEALAANETDVAELVEAVPKLRADWKRLDSHSRASQEQWQRFDQALNQAFQPVLAQRAEQSARQDAARQARNEFLDEAENWLKGLTWEQETIAETQRQRSELRNRWRALPRAGHRDERKLQARFETLMSDVEAGIAPHLKEETERRERLIAAAVRLQTEVNTREAVAQARTLQQRWREHPSNVIIPRQQSEMQWQQFRQAIDVIFARRDAERTAREAANQEYLATRQAILDEFEAVLDGAPELNALESALAVFRERWQPEDDAEKPRQRDALEPRFAALIRRSQATMRELRKSRQQAFFQLIARKAELAQQLESAAVSGQVTAPLAEEIQENWRKLPPLPGEVERKLAERLQAAASATPAVLEEGHRRREELLIDLEVLLDLPTPEPLATARQARQLALLQGGFRDLRSTEAMLGKVISWHAIAAAPEASQSERMARAMEKLAGLMTGDHP